MGCLLSTRRAHEEPHRSACFFCSFTQTVDRVRLGGSVRLDWRSDRVQKRGAGWPLAFGLEGAGRDAVPRRLGDPSQAWRTSLSETAEKPEPGLRHELAKVAAFPGPKA